MLYSFYCILYTFSVISDEKQEKKAKDVHSHREEIESE